MTTVFAKFDGKVLIPEGPLDLPQGQVLKLVYDPEPELVTEDRPLMRLARALQGLPSDPNSPTDGAAQHDHYLYGTPKRDDA
jgi:hypothetical protein